MRKYRTWHEVLIEQLADSTEAIGYLDLSLEEYQVDGDLPFFLKGIRNVVEAQGGVPEVAKHTGMDPQTLSKILSSEETLLLDTFATILKALGCRLSIEPLETERSCTEMGDVDAPVGATESAATVIELTTDNQ